VTDGDHEELLRLRDWRHEVVTPALAAAGALLKVHEDRLAAIEPRVAALARADEIADAVTERMKAARRGLLTTGEKIGGALVGLASVAAVVSQWFH
jgi:hypothetical protein